MMSSLEKLASKSNHRHRHVVLIKRGGAIISRGYNLRGRHAEVSALNKLWANERVGTTVYSYRYRRCGGLGLARPCPRCLKYLIANGIKCVFYSTNEQKIERLDL